MASQVATLREFRDRYLLTCGAGRAFVAFYYRWSPPAADVIAASEPLRAMVRCALVPAVLTADLFVFSPVAGSLFAAFCALGLGVGLKRLRSPLRRRRQARVAAARA